MTSTVPAEIAVGVVAPPEPPSPDCVGASGVVLVATGSVCAGSLGAGSSGSWGVVSVAVPPELPSPDCVGASGVVLVATGSLGAVSAGSCGVVSVGVVSVGVVSSGDVAFGFFPVEGAPVGSLSVVSVGLPAPLPEDLSLLPPKPAAAALAPSRPKRSIRGFMRHPLAVCSLEPNALGKIFCRKNPTMWRPFVKLLFTLWRYFHRQRAPHGCNLRISVIN